MIRSIIIISSILLLSACTIMPGKPVEDSKPIVLVPYVPVTSPDTPVPTPGPIPPKKAVKPIISPCSPHDLWWYGRWDIEKKNIRYLRKVSKECLTYEWEEKQKLEPTATPSPTPDYRGIE